MSPTIHTPTRNPSSNTNFRSPVDYQSIPHGRGSGGNDCVKRLNHKVKVNPYDWTLISQRNH